MTTTVANKCPTCKGMHYLPFVKPDGLVSQYAQSPCPNCGGYDHERGYADANMPDRRPEDFDFPCSETWRRFYGGDQQGAVSPVGEPDPLAVTPKNGGDQLDDWRWESVQQLQGQVLWLSKKVTERQAKKAHPKKYEKYT